jgi:cyclic pyranopterin phosphate synthase
MVDQYGRAVDYLRVSVTDRCNLRCVYCIPQEGIQTFLHEEILTYEEIVRIAKAAASLGVTKIKVTGGEPLVRKGVSHLIWALKNIGGIQTVTLTSNGVLFSEFGRQLADAGLDGVNFSIDSLNPQAYFQITRRDALDGALHAVSLALEYGLTTKINCVPILEYGKADVIALAQFARRHPIAVRFIELMPIGLGKQFTPVLNSEILAMLKSEYGEPVPSPAHGNGPAV